MASNVGRIDMAVRTIAELRNTADEDLIWDHDSTAAGTVAGVDYYLNELARRDAKRQGDRIESLTQDVKHLTVWLVIMTVVITTGTVINLLVFIFSL